MARLNLNVGDTFITHCTLKTPQGVPVPIGSGIVVSAEAISTNGSKIQLTPINFNQTTNPGKFGFRSETSSWILVHDQKHWDIYIRMTKYGINSSHKVEVKLHD